MGNLRDLGSLFYMEEISYLDGVVQRIDDAEKFSPNPVLPLDDLREWDSMQALYQGDV